MLEYVKNEVVSIESTRKNYGVVIDKRALIVDEEATGNLRGERKNT